MNLAKTEIRQRSRPQTTFRRETTMPRQGTETPTTEVNARIQRPRMDDADELSRLLGLANDVGQSFIKGKQDEADKKDAAEAELDFSAGQRDDKRFKKSYAYYDSYQREGAKALALQLSTEITDSVNELLNDPDNPATLDDVNELIESHIRSRVMGPDGKLLDFGTPEAKAILGHALGEVRSTILPQAHAAIKAQMDERLLGTWATNRLAEWGRGAAIGAPVKVEVEKDPLAPLDGPAEAPAKPERMVSLGKPTGRLPVQGTITSTAAAHSKRGSAGLDIDAKYGDPVEAPAGGRVIEVGNDKKSGLYVKVDHGNGIVSSYAHLSAAQVKKGDAVRPGVTIARVGNSGHVSSKGGDGSHLHYRIKVNGKDVDPQSFRYGDGTALAGAAPTGDDPELLTAEQMAAQQPPLPPFNFEAALKDLPPSISKGTAKKYLLQTMFNEANDKGDARILAGLEDSKRADGTPSFTPPEIDTILGTREAIQERIRIRTERAEKELQQNNAETVMQAFLEGKEPSHDFLVAATRSGQLDVDFAVSLERSLEAERKADEREARADAKQAAAEAEAEVDADVYSEVTLRNTGMLAGVSAEADMERFKSGQLGTGKKAMARFRQLRAAARAGEAELNRDPAYGHFAGLIKSQYGPKQAGSGSLLMKARGITSGANYPAMLSHYQNKVRSGTPPAEAYQSAIAAFGPKKAANTRQAMMDRAAELRAKRLTGGQ